MDKRKFNGNPKGTNNGGGTKPGQKLVKEYHIFTDGSVWAEYKTRCTLMQGYLDRKGYRRFNQWGKDVEGHLLVARKYLPNPNNLPQVDHINRNRSDNRLENLRWVTRQENCDNRIFGGSLEKAIELVLSHGYQVVAPS